VNSKIATATSPTPATPSSGSPVPSQNVPLTPPPPPASLPPAAASKPKRKFFRRFFTTLFLLTTLGFGGGIYYSRINDNFHDFFTEYIPFGEDAVLYFEERDFRKRFPRIASRSERPRDTGNTKNIPSQSGVSWRVADDNKSATARHANAKKDEAPKPKEAIQTPSETKPEEQVKAVENVKKDTDTPASSKPSPQPPIVGKSPEPQPQFKPAHPVTTEAAPKSATPATPQSFVAPEVDQPSKFPPELTRIDPINIKDANEPLVQDLVKILNDIITVVNADNSNSRFSTTIEKAKGELTKVGSKIKA